MSLTWRPAHGEPFRWLPKHGAPLCIGEWAAQNIARTVPWLILVIVGVSLGLQILVIWGVL